MAATRPGVLPTALSSPTRRLSTAIRLPTSTATLATASRPSSQLPISRTLCSFLTRLAALKLMFSHEFRNGADAEVCELSYALAKASASDGSASFRFSV